MFSELYKEQPDGQSQNRSLDSQDINDESFQLKFSASQVEHLVQTLLKNSKNDQPVNQGSYLPDLVQQFDDLIDGKGQLGYRRQQKRAQLIDGMIDQIDHLLYDEYDEDIDKNEQRFIKPTLHKVMDNLNIRDMKTLVSDLRQAVYTKLGDDSKVILNHYHAKQTKTLQQFIAKFPRTHTTLTDTVLEQMCSLVYKDSVQIKMDSIKSRIADDLDRNDEYVQQKSDTLTRIKAELDRAKGMLKEAERQTNHTMIMSLNQHIAELQHSYNNEDSKQYVPQQSSTSDPIPAFSRGFTLHQFKINQKFVVAEPYDSTVNSIRIQHTTVVQYTDYLFNAAFQEKENNQKQLIKDYLIVCEWVCQLYQQTQTEWYDWFVQSIRPQIGVMKQLQSYNTALKETMNQRSLMGVVNKLSFANVQETDFQMVVQPQPTQDEASLLHTAFCGQLDLFFQRMSDEISTQRQPIPSLGCKLQRVSNATHYDNNFIPDLEGLQQGLVDTQQDMYHSTAYMSKQSAHGDQGLFDHLNFKTSLHHAANMVNDIALLESIIDCIMLTPGQFRVGYEVFITQCSLTTRQVMIGLNTQHSTFNLQLKQSDFLICSQLDNEQDFRYTHTKVFVKSIGIMYDMACVFLSLFTHRFNTTTTEGVQASTLLRLQADAAEVLLRKSLKASRNAMVHLLDNSTIQSKVETLHSRYNVPYADPITGLAVNYQIANYVNFSNSNSDLVRRNIFEQFLSHVGVEVTIEVSQYYYEFQARQDMQQVLNRGGLCNGVIENQYALQHLRVNAMKHVASSQHLSSCIAGNYFCLAEVFYTDNSSTFKLLPQLARGRNRKLPIRGPLSLQDIIEDLYANQSVSIDSAVTNMLETAQLASTHTYGWQRQMVDKAVKDNSTLSRAKILYALAMMNMQAGRTNFTRLQVAILVAKQSLESTSQIDSAFEAIKNELNSELARNFQQEQYKVQTEIRAKNANDYVPLHDEYNRYLDQRIMETDEKMNQNQTFVEYRRIKIEEWDQNKAKAQTVMQLVQDSQERNRESIKVVRIVDQLIRQSIEEVMELNDSNRKNYMHNIINQSSAILSLIQDKIQNHQFRDSIMKQLSGRILTNIVDRNENLSEQSEAAIDNIESLYSEGQKILKTLIRNGMYQLQTFKTMGEQYVSNLGGEQMTSAISQILQMTVAGEVDSHRTILELFDSRVTPLADMGRCSTLLADMFFRNKTLTTQAALMDSVNQLINIQLKVANMFLPTERQKLYQDQLIKSPQTVLLSHMFLLGEDNHEVQAKGEQLSFLMKQFSRTQQVKVYKKMFNQSRWQMWTCIGLATSVGIYLAASWIYKQDLREQYNVPNIYDLAHQYTVLQLQHTHYKMLSYMNFFFYKKEDVSQLNTVMDAVAKQKELLTSLIAVNTNNHGLDALNYIGFSNLEFDFGGANNKEQFSYQSFIKRSVSQPSSFLYLEQLIKFVYASPFSKDTYITLLQTQQTNLAVFVHKAKLYTKTMSEIIVDHADQSVITTLRALLQIEKNYLEQVSTGRIFQHNNRTELMQKFQRELAYVQDVLIPDIDRFISVLDLLPENPQQFLKQMTDVVFTEEERKQRETDYETLLSDIQKANPVSDQEAQEIEELAQSYMVNYMKQSFVATSIGLNDMVMVTKDLSLLLSVFEDRYVHYNIYKQPPQLFNQRTKPNIRTDPDAFSLMHSRQYRHNTTEDLSKDKSISFVGIQRVGQLMVETSFSNLSTNVQLKSLHQSRILNIGGRSLNEVFGGTLFMQQVLISSDRFIASDIDLIEGLDQEMIDNVSQAQNMHRFTVRAKLDANVAYDELVRKSYRGLQDLQVIEDDPFVERMLDKTSIDNTKNSQVKQIYLSLIDMPMFLESMKMHANVKWLQQAYDEFKQPVVSGIGQASSVLSRASGKAFGLLLKNYEVTSPSMFGYEDYYGMSSKDYFPQKTVLMSFNNKAYITVNGTSYPNAGTFMYNALNVASQYATISEQLRTQSIRFEEYKDIGQEQKIDFDAYNSYATSALVLIGVGITATMLVQSRKIIRGVQEVFRTNKLINQDAERIIEDQSKLVYNQSVMPSQSELDVPLNIMEMAVRVDSRRRMQVEDIKYAIFNNFVSIFFKGMIKGVAQSLFGYQPDMTDARQRFYTQNQAQLKNRALGHIFGSMDPMKMYQISQLKGSDIAQHAYRIPSMIFQGLQLYSNQKDVATYQKSLVKQFSDDLSKDQRNALQQLLTYGGEGLEQVLNDWQTSWTITDWIDFDKVYQISLKAQGIDEPAVYRDFMIRRKIQNEIAAYENEQAQRRDIVVEPPVEAVVEPPVEAVVEPPVEAVAEPPVEAVAEPPVEAVAEPPVEAVAEPPVEAVPQLEEQKNEMDEFQFAFDVQPRNAVLRLNHNDGLIRNISRKIRQWYEGLQGYNPRPQPALELNVGDNGRQHLEDELRDDVDMAIGQDQLPDAFDQNWVVEQDMIDVNVPYREGLGFFRGMLQNELVQIIQREQDLAQELQQDNQLVDDIAVDLVAQAARQIAEDEAFRQMAEAAGSAVESKQLAVPQQPTRLEVQPFPFAQPKPGSAKPAYVKQTSSAYPQPIVPSKFLEPSHIDSMLAYTKYDKPLVRPRFDSPPRVQQQQEETKEETKEVVQYEPLDAVKGRMQDEPVVKVQELVQQEPLDAVSEMMQDQPMEAVQEVVQYEPLNAVKGVMQDLMYYTKQDQPILKYEPLDSVYEILEHNREMEEEYVNKYVEQKIKEQQQDSAILEQEIKKLNKPVVGLLHTRPRQEQSVMKGQSELVRSILKRREQKGVDKGFDRIRNDKVNSIFDVIRYRGMSAPQRKAVIPERPVPSPPAPKPLLRKPLATREEVKKERDSLVKDVQADTMMDSLLLLMMGSMESDQHQASYRDKEQIMRSLVIADRHMQKGTTIRKKRLRKMKQKMVGKTGQPLLSKKALNDIIKSNLREVF